MGQLPLALGTNLLDLSVQAWAGSSSWDITEKLRRHSWRNCHLSLLRERQGRHLLGGLEGVPGLPGAPQDEAGLTRKCETSHVGGATEGERERETGRGRGRGCIFKKLTMGKNVHQFSSVAQSCATLSDPIDCSTPGLPVHH